MKLNASKITTRIVSKLRTMHSQSATLTIGGTVLEESDDLDILGVAFDSKITSEKNLKIGCNPMHPLCGALPRSYVPVRVTRRPLVAHWYTYASPRSTALHLFPSRCPCDVPRCPCVKSDNTHTIIQHTPLSPYTCHLRLDFQ